MQSTSNDIIWRVYVLIGGVKTVSAFGYTYGTSNEVYVIHFYNSLYTAKTNVSFERLPLLLSEAPVRLNSP